MEDSVFQLAKPSNGFEDPAAVRKLQKAGREKKRRDLLNEHFCQLETALHADRPKNDKSTILNDTIQLLKELTTEVDKLKAEHAALNEESHELTQEKNDLREEKAALKSDIERLNVQCQGRVGSTFPCVAPDSVLPHPSSYPYPMPIAFPQAPMPIHPYPYFSSPNPAIFQNPYPPYIPYMTPNPPPEHWSTQYISPSSQPHSRTEDSGRQAVRNSSVGEMENQIDKNKGPSDFATMGLELKTPGSVTDQHNTSNGESKGRKPLQNKKITPEGSFSSECSSHSIQDSSSDSVVGGGQTND